MITRWKKLMIELNTKLENKLKILQGQAVASYKTDKATYEMYKDSDNEEKQSWAEQAKNES